MILGPAQVAAFTSGTDPALVVAQASILHGWSMLETSGASSARVDVYDGQRGVRIATVALCPGESVRDWFSGAAIYAAVGLYLDVVSGSVAASLWFRPATAPGAHGHLDVDALVEQVIDTIWAGSR